jgi:hypothetical protein
MAIPVQWTTQVTRRLWLALVVVLILGFSAVFLALPTQAQMEGRLVLFCAACTALITALAAAPLFSFLGQGWAVRYAEILAELPEERLAIYLRRFWPDSTNAGASAQNAKDTFERLYVEQYGRGRFIIPVFLLIIILFIEVVLSVLRWRGVIAFPTDESAAIALAAMGGTYMFLVGDSVASVRRRSLNIADVYWYALRAALSVPIGIAAKGLAPGGTAPFVAFGLGLMPVDALLKVFRRLTMTKLSASEDAGDDDQLIMLDGVTIDVASRFTAEGITSIDQLACMDPVLLAIRTGLPLQFVIRLASQAVVRGHLGKSAANLVPIGLCDVRAISALLQNRQAAESQATLDDAAARLHTTDAPTSPTPKTFLFVLEQIMADPRTPFLL